MKQALRRIARSGINYARHSRLANWLRENSSSNPQQAETREVFAIFTDSRGETHQLIKGYRDRIKPDWRKMFDPPAESLTAEELAIAPTASAKSIDKMLHFLAINDFSLQKGKVLEIGSHLGHRAFALSLKGEFEVTGLYLPDYYVQQIPGQNVDHTAQPREVSRLGRMQEQLRDAFRATTDHPSHLDRVNLVGADITTLSMPDGYFDLIVSWETLEHIRDTEPAFQNMFRLLKPGGIAFHEYDPFFNIEGGHSLCTLDFPYSHARLNAEDFEAYLRRFRPDEADVALRYYHNNLNRMSFADLRRVCDNCGFKIPAIIEWPDTESFIETDAAALRQAQSIYPTVTVNDLMARRAWILLQKPASVQGICK
ncbi:MAG: class I SAM-dependent methyltransferase [Acidobacteriota bacterium]